MKRELRLLLTADCNFNCFFCHHEGINPTEKNIFSADDYLFLYDAFNNIYSTDCITLTGGEPLIRNDLEDILFAFFKRNLKITLVTNGYLIKKKYNLIKTYIERVNVSLHSVNSKVFSKLTGTGLDSLNCVLEGVKFLSENNDKTEIRLNTTIVKRINDDDFSLTKLINYAKEIGASIKFIELYPDTKDEFVSLSYIEKFLRNNGFVFLERNDRQISFIKDKQIILLTQIFCAHAKTLINTSEFCKEKQDLFITPSGMIKTCMNKQNGVSIVNEVLHRDINKLESKIIEAVKLFGKCN